MAKVSFRTCLGCRSRAPKGELIRVVWNERALVIDRSWIEGAKALPGRGAYLHDAPSCWLNVVDKQRWERALKLEKGRLSAGMIEKLLTQLRSAEGTDAVANDSVRGKGSSIRTRSKVRL